jgi:arabinan endo-1,5-alpha-L-arabinosidase
VLVRQHPRRHRQAAHVPQVLLVLLVALLAACGGSSSGGTSTKGSTNGGTGAAAPAGTLKPVLDEDFPDPDVMKAGDTYYGYATQRTGPFGNLQLATSKDLATWQLSSTDPLPHLPAWATAGRTWAPDVSAVPGGYVMYFAAHSVKPDVQCIGVARASRPTGPFTPVGTAPLVCPADEGGAIDPASFVDTDGSRYLLWKNDGNCCGKDTWLSLQKTSADGLRITGPRVKLVKEDQPWEGALVEAPDLVRHGEIYTLLYSANDYSGDKYATGYATASNLTGPYRKAPQPLLSTGSAGVIGPGGEDAVEGPGGRPVVVFHGWDSARTHRAMYVLPLTWQEGVPAVAAG